MHAQGLNPKTSFFLAQILNPKSSFFLGRRDYKIPQTRTAEISSGKQTGPVPVYFPETFAIPDNQVQARKKRNKD
jgi:hypothetical protein